MQLHRRCSPVLALACEYENACTAESKAQTSRFCLSVAVPSVIEINPVGNIAKLGSATASIADCPVKNISVRNLQAAEYLSQASGGTVFEYTLFRICPLEEGSLKLGLPPSGLPPTPSMSPAQPRYSLLSQTSVQLTSACTFTPHRAACPSWAGFCVTRTLHAGILISTTAAACRSLGPLALSTPEGLDLLLQLTSRSDSSWRWGRSGGQRLLLHAAPGLKLLPVPPRHQRVVVLLRVCRRCMCSDENLSTAGLAQGGHPQISGCILPTAGGTDFQPSCSLPL